MIGNGARKTKIATNAAAAIDQSTPFVSAREPVPGDVYARAGIDAALFQPIE